MKGRIRTWKVLSLLGLMLFSSAIVFAEGLASDSLPGNNADLPLLPRRFIHRIGLEVRPGFVIPTNSFYRGDNEAGKPIKSSLSGHLKYAFQAAPGTYADRIYNSSYQGFGLACYTFDERKQLGDPIAFYLFQGARIARFNPWISLNYEWNFGLSAGWKPYNSENNTFNKVIGSEINAYMNTNFYLSWMLSRQFDLTTGVSLSHFSNGNTKFPNAGLNVVDFKIGLVYNFNRQDKSYRRPLFSSPIPPFPRHISYDLVLFGSWRRKGVAVGEEQVASPDAYTVLGFNFAPMYNIGYKFRAGISLDGVYDASANVYTKSYVSGNTEEFITPPLANQLTLGVSARAEYVMPYFTVGLGLGANVLHGGGDFNSFYQILALKVAVTRSSFLHIGYCLQDFHTPNYLMLGIGFRFNNKTPVLLRR